jgi:hypothetical protein
MPKWSPENRGIISRWIHSQKHNRSISTNGKIYRRILLLDFPLNNLTWKRRSQLTPTLTLLISSNQFNQLKNSKTCQKEKSSFNYSLPNFNKFKRDAKYSTEVMLQKYSTSNVETKMGKILLLGKINNWNNWTNQDQRLLSNFNKDLDLNKKRLSTIIRRWRSLSNQWGCSNNKKSFNKRILLRGWSN